MPEFIGFPECPRVEPRAQDSGDCEISELQNEEQLCMLKTTAQ
jgi:hypothetical protein